MGAVCEGGLNMLPTIGFDDCPWEADIICPPSGTLLGAVDPAVFLAGPNTGLSRGWYDLLGSSSS